MILIVDFSRNYDNKKRYETQSVYFGYEAFTLFTAVCYCHDSTLPEPTTVVNVDQEIGL